MESPSARKRKRSTPPIVPPVQTPSPGQPTTKADIDALIEPDDDSTDFKLALLSSVHSEVDQSMLMEILLGHDGDVEQAKAWLSGMINTTSKPSAGTGHQSSIASYVQGNENGTKKTKLLSRKGQTLYLYSPHDVQAHTPCSIIHNVLSPDVATALLLELLEESQTYKPVTFKLFDNVVKSPHTTCFYVSTNEEVQGQKTDYIYNGGILDDVRKLTPEMRKITPRLQSIVQSQIDNRIQTSYPDRKKLKYQSPHPWMPNAAFVNCYNGGQENVGYHSDQLTYLGPRAVIASLSLGVAREFRVRRIIPVDQSTLRANRPPEDADLEGQISIHLPHNSLLVMHAEMQEEWKHSIAPAQTVEPHPISGNKRINITYREYKANLHPKFTPRCQCNVPCVLRVVQRKKENHGKYFWMCHAGNVPGKDGCSFFEWAVFDDDGNPIWKRRSVTQRQ